MTSVRPAVLRLAGIAALGGALAASLGDLLLLRVAAAGNPALAIPGPPAPATLLAGHYLGVLAIPLYALGYWQAACGIAPGDPRRARAVVVLGAAGAALGAVIHGMTGLALATALDAGGTGDPLAVVTRHGAYLVPLWAAVALLTLAGSVLFAQAIRRGGTAFPRWMAAANPLALTLVLAALATPTAALRALVLPAAPNLAHVVFFACTTALIGRRAPAGLPSEGRSGHS